jgi:hypothetical protein
MVVCEGFASSGLIVLNWLLVLNDTCLLTFSSCNFLIKLLLLLTVRLAILFETCSQLSVSLVLHQTGIKLYVSLTSS